MTKSCIKCGHSDFCARGDCKICAKAYRAKNSEKIKARHIAYRESNKDKIKAYSNANKDRAKAYREANQEQIKAYREAYYAKNADKVKANTAAYREANKDVVNAYQADYRKANSDKLKAHGAAYYKANPEKARARNAAWHKANPEAMRIIQANRRARKRDAGGKLSKGLSAKLFKLQKGKCACCAKPLGDNFHLDHIMPLVLGGSNTDDNMQLLRQRCNNQKHAKHPIEFMQSRGFLL